MFCISRLCKFRPFVLPHPPHALHVTFPSSQAGRRSAAAVKHTDYTTCEAHGPSRLSLQTKWMNNELSTGSLWIPPPIVVLLWLFDLPYWNADDCPINNAKSRFPGGEAGRAKHLAYRWKPAVSVPLSLWPRAALSFIGLNRQSIQQPCMRDEGMRQAVNDEEPKIKGLTPS